MTALVSTRARQGDHRARPDDTIAVVRELAEDQA